MRTAWLILSLLLLNTCFSAEPGVIILPQKSSLLREWADFTVINGGIRVNAGVRAVNNINNLLITIYPSTGVITDYELSLNESSINHSLTQVDGYYLLKPEINFTNNNLIIIELTINLSPGTHLLVIDFSSAETSHRIESALVINESYEPLIINQSDWVQFNAVIGKQVAWVSNINVFNPNERPLDALINALLVPDYSSVQLIGEGSLTVNGLSAYCHDSFSGLENKRYLLTLLTPPIIESSQSMTVVNSSSESVIISSNLSFTNLAGLDYTNASYDFDVKFNNVINVSCINCSWRESNGLLRIVFNHVASGEFFNALINYLDKPPLLAVTPSPRFYNPNSSVSLNINLIPERLIKGLNLEVEVTAPDGDTAFADLISYDEVSASRPFSTSLIFSLVNVPEGNYTVTVKAHEGLNLIASSENWFIISSVPISSAWILLIIAPAIAIALFFLFKRAKKF